MTRMKIIKMLRAVCDRNDGNPEALKQELSAMLGDIAKTMGTFIGATSESSAEDGTAPMAENLHQSLEARIMSKGSVNKVILIGNLGAEQVCRRHPILVKRLQQWAMRWLARGSL